MCEIYGCDKTKKKPQAPALFRMLEVKLKMGLEPTTPSLRVKCSTD